MTRRFSGAALVALAAPLAMAILIGAYSSAGAPGVSVAPTNAPVAPSAPSDETSESEGTRDETRELSYQSPISPLSPPGEIEYTIQPGDTLSRIALIFDVSVDTLVESNDIPDPDLLTVGSRLTVLLPLDREAPHHTDLPPVEKQLREAERAYGLPHGLFLALAWRESTWDQDAVSSAGAIGVAQVLPSTAQWAQDALLEIDHDWRGSARDNAHVGAAYLRHLIDRADGDIWVALAAYYQGWNSLHARGPFFETRRYVEDVLGLVSRFQ